MRISDHTNSRDNNFNLIRIIAAYAVLVTHSFAIAIGSVDAEPFRSSTGMTIGSIAVDVFFITSGFLVTASLLNRRSTIEFAWARVLRIFPALLVMLLLSVFILGLSFTTHAASSYLSDPKTYKYLFKCLFLFSGPAYELPGVFENNPYKDAVNGSLWTLPYELRMYAILALLWLAFRMTPAFRPKIFKITILVSTATAGVFVILSYLEIIRSGGNFLKLFFMFFAGAAFYILKEQIVLSKTTFFIVLTILILALADKRIFFLIYILTIPYVLFYVAYVPSGVLRKYNKLGDYSYGVYIYAFPIQQSIAALIPGVSVFSMSIISSIFTIFFAVLSWHFLEKHALKLKGFYVNHTKRLMRFD
jgi:peptidoglycan/LPS O-acetylase OafA/YrhL